MEQYIPKSALVSEIERLKTIYNDNENIHHVAKYNILVDILSFLDALEVKDVNGWIDCTKQMPKETKQTSDTLQGHREWTESDMVLVWDSMYGCGIDSTRNGKWRREGKGGYTGQVVHGIIAWRPIPEFNENLI